MKFTIDWSYLGRDGSAKSYRQKYYLSIDKKYCYVQAPPFCAGAYISNLINACNIGNVINGERENNEGLNGYLESVAYSAWRSILGDRQFGRRHLYNERREFDERDTDGFITQRRAATADFMLYDSMAFPAFCIFSNIKTMLKDAGYCLIKSDWRGWSDCSKAMLGEQTIGMLENQDDRNGLSHFEIIQSAINEYISDYNKLLMSSTGDRGIEFYNSLRACLEKYNDGRHKLIEEYLATKNKHIRCFATFIRQSDGKKFIAFSGSLDVKHPRILSWLGRSKPKDFVCVAEEICSALNNAELVPLNLQTRKYYIIDYSTGSIGQDMSIDDLINNNIDNAIVGEYSCCERKIFGGFDDHTPNGTLYVKLPICERCALGLKYQLSNGVNITLYDGLM